MEITLAKALKLKNKLVREMGQHYTKFSMYNSHQDDQKMNFDPKAEYTIWRTKSAELVKLKTAISGGNQAINEDIIKMGELKSLISNLQGVATREGVEIRESRWENKPDVKITYVAFMNDKGIADTIKELEQEIEACQDRIDKHNHTTTIKVAD
jgi:hypothetical protein